MKQKITLVDFGVPLPEELKVEKRGFQKPPRKRPKKGERGGSIATKSVDQLTSEEFDILVKKSNLYANGNYVLPPAFRVTKSMRMHLGSYCTMVGKELGLEIIAIKPDLEKIKSLLDPMNSQR